MLRISITSTSGTETFDEGLAESVAQSNLGRPLENVQPDIFILSFANGFSRCLWVFWALLGSCLLVRVSSHPQGNRCSVSVLLCRTRLHTRMEAHEACNQARHRNHLPKTPGVRGRCLFLREPVVVVVVVLVVVVVVGMLAATPRGAVWCTGVVGAENSRVGWLQRAARLATSAPKTSSTPMDGEVRGLCDSSSDERVVVVGTSRSQPLVLDPSSQECWTSADNAEREAGTVGRSAPRVDGCESWHTGAWNPRT